MKFPFLDGWVQQLHHQDLSLLSFLFSWNHNCSTLHEWGFPEAARKGVRVRTAIAHTTDLSWHTPAYSTAAQSVHCSISSRLWYGWKCPLKARVPAHGTILVWSGNFKRYSHCGHALWDFLYEVHPLSLSSPSCLSSVTMRSRRSFHHAILS